MEELATGYGLVEGPVWDGERGLIYSDVVNGGVWALSETGDISTIIPKRRGVGGIVLHEDGGVLVGGRDIIFQSFDGTRRCDVLTSGVTAEAIGFNDFTTDPEGRLWAGSVAFRVLGDEPIRPGHLHVVDLDGSIRTVADGVQLTNGMGFSPDGGILYHCDSRACHIRAYDIDDAGAVTGYSVLIDRPGQTTDGMAVAVDGSIWVAIANGGCVSVFESDGSHREDIPVPVPMVTSVCFGGADLQDLYIVTGSRGGPHENCGGVYRRRVDVPGVPVAPARVALNL
jgi:xylono-1,5-lactonase